MGSLEQAARTVEINIAAAVFVGVPDHLVDVVFGQVAAEFFQDPPAKAHRHNLDPIKCAATVQCLFCNIIV